MRADACAARWGHGAIPAPPRISPRPGPTVRRCTSRLRGAYGVVEVDLLADDASQLTAFLRLGLSDPHTTPYRGGLQAGFLLAPAIAGREDSQVSLGLHHAWTSDHFREAVRSPRAVRRPTRRVVELTYADRVFGPLVLQPDIQWVRHPGGDRARQDAVVAIMRARLSF